MKRTFILVSGLVLLTAAVTSWAQEGPITSRQRDSLRASLRGLRLAADQQARNCDQEGQARTAGLMRQVSSAAVGINLQLGVTIRTWASYRARVASDILPLSQEVSAAPDVNTCRPSLVSNQINQLAGFPILAPGAR